MKKKLSKVGERVQRETMKTLTLISGRHWEADYQNLDTDPCYNRFCQIYNESVERYVPAVGYKGTEKVSI